MEDSSDEDLLGLHSFHSMNDAETGAATAADTMKKESPFSPEKDQMVKVNVLPLGKPLDLDSSTATGEASADAMTPSKHDAKQRRRRKQSPVAMLRESIADRKSLARQPRASAGGGTRSRQRRTVAGGEKIYQGRMNRGQREQSDPSRQSSSHEHSQHSISNRPQHAQTSSSSRHTHNPPRAGGSAGAPWKEIKKEVRRRSRDGASQIRRRLSMTVPARKKGDSMDGGERDGGGLGDTDHQLEKLRRDARAGRENISSRRDSGGDGRRESKADSARDRRESSSRAAGSKADSDKVSRKNMGERKLSQSLGHALKKDCNSSDSDDNSDRSGLEKKLSTSMFDSRDVAKSIGGSSHSSDLSPPAPPKRTYGLLNMRDQLKRAGSLDTSMRDLEASEKEESSSPTTDKPRPGMRRASFDCSVTDLQKMKVKEGTAEDDNDSPGRRKSRAPRRKSLDSSFNINGGTDNDLPRARMERRRSNSAGPPIHSSKHGVDENDWDASKDDDDGVDEFIKKMYGSTSPKPKKGDKRKTHTGVASASERRRKSDNSGSDSRRKSEYAKTLEKRMKQTSKKKKRQSALVVSKTKNQKRPSQRTEETIPESAEMSAASSKRSSQSATVMAVAEDSSYGSSSRGRRKQKKKQKKKRWGVTVSPWMMCTLCLCYMVSIMFFCGLGFFLHMTFFGEDSEQASSSSNVDVNAGDSDQGSDQNDNTDGGTSEIKNIGVAPSLRPSSFNNTDESISPTDDNGTSVTKLSPGSQPPLSSPTKPPVTFPAETSTYMPTLLPSSPPSLEASSSPSLSMQPSYAPSAMPSFSPTSIPGCPEELLKSASLGTDGLLTMKYEVVIYPENIMDGVGGLLCASLEYTGGSAGWIGLAFSEANRNPTFGRKEAIIGMPGIIATAAVQSSDDSSTGLGQQNAIVDGGPSFANPGKYAIPPGGMDGKGYYGPSLTLLSNANTQTLVNGSVSIQDPYAYGGVISDQSTTLHTQMSFAKYLKEPGEIEIDPYSSTLILYAVATPGDGGTGEYDGNPGWKSTYLTLLSSSSNAKSAGIVRKRGRQHRVGIDSL